MTKKYGFGIIGCGMISKWHADSIISIDDATLIGVADTSKERASSFAADYNCTAFDSVEELLASDKIDIVCICTPSGLHAELSIKAANAGKHFIVEKPMAITKEQIDGIISACEKNNVKGTVVSQLRFIDSINKAKSAVESGKLGKIVLGDLYMKFYRSPEYYASAGWRGTWSMDGGGALMNQGIHGIDILQYIAGPVKSVYGVCKTLVNDIEVEDTANLIVEYENGATGVIQGTTSVNPGYPRRIEISGTKGTIILTDGQITSWDVEGEEGAEVDKVFSDAETFKDPSAFSIDLHRLQIIDAINALKEDRAPAVDVYEGKKAVDIILAAYESSRTGKKIEL
ncbi:MAG: Gfo/Idh/MocA family oxidoreductase [Oscillospiraceae bacterium]|nr:Gfo/Idh/MocA family oxidoreductase [Oscillospiraceae bacterium]